MDDRTADLHAIENENALRGLYGAPMELALLKQLDRLDAHCRNFLAHAPFCVIASTRAGKGADVSPRGDAPGFARVLDDYTIAIPDRPGNNRLDTMSNIVADAEVEEFRAGIGLERGPLGALDLLKLVDGGVLAVAPAANAFREQILNVAFLHRSISLAAARGGAMRFGGGTALKIKNKRMGRMGRIRRREPI